MPEGPSIVILKELLQPFKRKKVMAASGDAAIDVERLQNLTVLDFRSWGKNTLICFHGFFLRIHLMMYGTYKINARKPGTPRLRLTFNTGEINFYTCIVHLIEGNADDQYDWESDVLSSEWNPLKAEKKIKSMTKEKVCDVLLDQEIFAGVGNIIKNEVLFRIKVHPESNVHALPLTKQKELIKEASNFSCDFYNWKKKNVLTKNLLVYGKKECSRCRIPLHTAYMGKGKRLTCYCLNCQVLYAPELVFKNS